MPRLLTFALSAILLAGCGGEDRPKPARVLTEPVQEAVSTVGDITVRANVIRTSQLNEAMARQYGIERSERRVMLLVAVRKGPEGQDTAVPATIVAKVSRLTGGGEPIAMREQRVGELLDYVGTLEIAPPETLRFDLDIVREGGARSSMQFTRDFLPE
jgi:Domain of unknown function (DUF4426)